MMNLLLNVLVFFLKKLATRTVEHKNIEKNQHITFSRIYHGLPFSSWSLAPVLKESRQRHLHGSKVCRNTSQELPIVEQFDDSHGATLSIQIAPSLSSSPQRLFVVAFPMAPS
jgi:hypothetical protein